MHKKEQSEGKNHSLAQVDAYLKAIRLLAEPNFLPYGSPYGNDRSPYGAHFRPLVASAMRMSASSWLSSRVRNRYRSVRRPVRAPDTRTMAVIQGVAVS